MARGIRFWELELEGMAKYLWRRFWKKLLKGKGQASETTRLFRINDRLANEKQDFAWNKIRTTKYTWYTYLPRGLFEQFRRVANFYFLFHCILTYTAITPVSPISATIPLVFVVGLAMLKELWEDIQRGDQTMK